MGDKHLEPYVSSTGDGRNVIDQTCLSLPTRLHPREIRPITDHEFDKLRTLIESEAGIHLGPIKRALLEGRLSRRLRALGMHTYSDYYRHVCANSDERVCMIDRICTNETRFFREAAHFDLLEREILPYWAEREYRAHQVRVWSAACSTGEEPCTLAMVLLAFFADASWSIDILGTDLSTNALDQARRATWSVKRAEEIPQRYLRKFMLRGVRSCEGLMMADDTVRSVICYQRLNLIERPYLVDGLFDLIFCRNVLIYFSPAVRQRVIGGLIERLAPGGFLFLGHAETIQHGMPGLECVIPTVYRRVEVVQ